MAVTAYRIRFGSPYGVTAEDGAHFLTAEGGTFDRRLPGRREFKRLATARRWLAWAASNYLPTCCTGRTADGRPAPDARRLDDIYQPLHFAMLAAQARVAEPRQRISLHEFSVWIEEVQP